ncbi:MAG: hypothetical protein HN978_09510 [Desulfobacula sp.]|uniref:hypothetical protein n=1 Tax=Desulfobacula sp. TaxID=2593537 RepID=UPI001DFC0343|nr:hypothetical protein [Desulfobacula sp.]MBT7049902.1 hypothetical protein [Desulfobacula sp.]MBT7629917.1 hypothetical protein [Desulfobacula sp.]
MVSYLIIDKAQVISSIITMACKTREVAPGIPYHVAQRGTGGSRYFSIMERIFNPAHLCIII